MALLDATYRTTKFTLPFFQLVVPSNSIYIPVPTFITENEETTSVSEGLNIIRNWNTKFAPMFFMADYSEAEIAASRKCSWLVKFRMTDTRQTQ